MHTDVDERIPETQPIIPKDLPGDLELSKLPLSVRAQNCFSAVGIRFAAELGGMALDDLLKMKNMGRKTAMEVIGFLSHLPEYQESIEKQGAETGGLLELAPGEVHQIPENLPENMKLKNLPLPVRAQNCFSREGIQYAAQLGGKTLNDLLAIKNMGQKTARQVFSLLSNLPDFLPQPDSTDPAPECLEHRREPAGILEFVMNLPGGRNRDMLIERLRGKTLEEIGTENGLTRERVRQLIEKQLLRRPKLREDRYGLLFERYGFSKEDFALAFDEPVETFMYLEIVCKTSANRKRILDESLLSDDEIEPALRKAAERAVYKNCVTIEGFRIPRNRPALADFVVKRYCRELTKYNDFVASYNSLLAELGMGENPSLVIEGRGYENILGKSMNVLWSQWRSFRYYNILGQDYEELLSAIDLEQYENIEFSTLKIFRDFPELMKQYDIRDEYELHNLLKKVWPQERDTVNFKKMPTIEIGAADRDGQVLALLLEYAPISMLDLAQKYEDAYGCKTGVVMGSYLKNFDLYFHDGIYSITSENLPEDQFKRMLQTLTKDFYTIAEIKRLYLREFPREDQNMITPYVIKTLGFRVYPGCSGYAIRNTYPTAADYFTEHLTGNNIVNLDDFDSALLKVVGFNSELYKLRASREIIEFQPKQYIHIRRLEESGITHRQLERYCDAVADAVEPGAYFTIESLRQDGFGHELEDLGFEDWFYSSIVCEDHDRFGYQRIGGNRLFRRGAKSVQLTDLLYEIVEHEQKIDLFDLREYMENRYGISLTADKLKEIIRGTDLYYDAIMDAVYDTYDTYWEEI